LGITSGVLGALSAILILHSIKHDEVSRVIPLMATTPIFVAIFAAFLINETFTPLIYFAIIVMFVGSFLLSFKFEAGLPKKIKSLELVILSNIIFAIATVMVKFVLSNGLDYTIYLFCGFFGFFLGTIPLWFSKKLRHNFSTNYKIFRNLKLVLLSESFALIAFLLVSYATLIGPISLITSLKSLNILFVCLFAFVIGKFRPKIMKEEFEGRVLWTKIIAIVLLLIGTFIMVS
ncbi:MAG: EamA family transporter, partial [Nanoarchaeota archaeon]|nr:EamA family transporter [Nanoarchaeota archaeon]